MTNLETIAAMNAGQSDPRRALELERAKVARFRKALEKIQKMLDHGPRASHQEVCRRGTDAWKVAFDALKDTSP